jgi:hypothetical protein
VTQSAPSLDEDLACPICSYSLRGLAEPRCPECGFQFDWDALRAAIKAKHAYLYEHGRGLAIMRMVRTFIHGLRPAKFWATLNAATEIRLRRLAIYWIVTATFVVAGILVLPYGNFVVTRTRLAMQTRKQISAMLANPAAAAQTKPILKQFGSANAVLDAYAPLPWSWRFWQTVPGMVTWRGLGRGYSESLVYVIYAAALAVLWPWITLALLGIFVQSRGRAKIRWAQLVRCVVYSGDIAIFCGVAAIVLNAFQASFDRRFQGAIPTDIVLMLLLMTAAGWKLSLALKKYLRMPHAAAVVASTQMIALLAVLIVIPYEATMWLIRALTLR